MSTFNPGDPVYVIMMDAFDPDELEDREYIFIARIGDVVFAAPGINGHRDLESVLEYLLNCTDDGDELPLIAVPVSDCYHTREAAKEAMCID